MDQLTSNSNRRNFVKQITILVAGTGTISLVPGLSLAAEIDRKGIPRSYPEAQGVSSAEILRFVETAEKSNAGLHSFMIIRHGNVIAEGWWAPYKPEIPHMLYSLSKNFTSTAIGLLIQEGRLNLEDKVISFFAEYKPAVVDPKLEKMTVRDLLTMSSGHETDTLRPLMSSKDGNWVKTYLQLPLKYEPGTRFVYNSGNTYMLSAILQKVTGEPMLDYLEPRLFKPLDIKGAAWDSDPRGINFGAAGLRLKTEDIAKFSLLYLQKGVWKGKRILTEKWIEEATSFKIRNDETGTPTKTEDDDIKQGFGYHFWLSRPIAQGAYRSEGAFCQYSIVMPRQDAVIAITAEGVSTKRVMDLCWMILLPAMKPGALPADKPGRKALEEKLQSLQLVAPKGTSTPAMAASVSGKQYLIESNPLKIQKVSFGFNAEATDFILQDDKGTYQIACGTADWKTGKTNMPGSPTNVLSGIPLFQENWKVAASGAWKDEQTFVMTWRFFETPHFDIVTCKFGKDELVIEYSNSVSRIIKSYKDPRPVLKGTQA